MSGVNQEKRGNVNGSSTGSDALADQLEAILHEMAALKDIPNALMAVEKMDKSFSWVGATGDAQPDGTALHVNTPYHIASVTKLYIASTALKLFERSLIQLDQPMMTYIREGVVEKLNQLTKVDFVEKITVQHLLSHSSGLPEYLEDRPKGGRGFVEGILEADHAFTLEDILDFIRDLPPHFPLQPLDAPKQKVRYCDTNFQLLIAIIEAVTGVSLHEAFTTYLYQPLGLEETHHPGTRMDVPEPAALWVDAQSVSIPLALRSFGDLISTLDDQLRFMRALMQGEVFDNPETLQMMMAHWNTFGFSLNPVRLSPGWPIEYGLGMMRFKIPRLFSPFKSVPAVVGHSGATGSWLFYCEELDVLLAGTVNQLSAGAVPFRFVPKILQAVAKTGI